MKKFIVDSESRRIVAAVPSDTLGVYMDNGLDGGLFELTGSALDIYDENNPNLYVNYRFGDNGMVFAYKVEAENIKREDGKLSFVWLLDRNATMHTGVIEFSLCMKLADGKEWNTMVFKDVIPNAIERELDADEEVEFKTFYDECVENFREVVAEYDIEGVKTELNGKVTALEQKVENTKSSLFESITKISEGKIFIKLESGTISESDGVTKSTNYTRIRNVSMIDMGSIESVVFPDGYQGWIYYFDENKRYIGSNNAWTQKYEKTDDVYFINFVIKNVSKPSTSILDEVETVERGIDAVWYIADSVERLDNAVINSLSTLSKLTLTPNTYTTIHKPFAQIGYNGFSSGIYDCVKGDRFKIKGYGGNDSRLWMFAKDDGTVIATATANKTEATPIIITAPNNATKLVVNNNDASGEMLLYKYVPVGEMLTEVSSKVDSIEQSVGGFVDDATAEKATKVMRSINRIANFGGQGTPPQNSIEGFKYAYKKGFRIILVDLLLTSDNVPVLWHDDNINSVYNFVFNGTALVPKNTVTISQTPYATVNSYDYGRYKGGRYVGTRICKFEDVCKLCRDLGMELYVELKQTLTTTQAKIVCDIVRNYGLSDKTSWVGGSIAMSEMPKIVAQIPNARVAYAPSTISADFIRNVKSISGAGRIFFFVWDTTPLTTDIVKLLAENDIPLEMGTPATASDMLAYFAKGQAYNYCTGVESDEYVSGIEIMKRVWE